MRREIEQHLTALLSAGEKATKVLEVDKKSGRPILWGRGSGSDMGGIRDGDLVKIIFLTVYGSSKSR